MQYINKISGPVSVFIFNYNQTLFYFFGDTHFSEANLCQPCHLSNCIDINTLLHLWFTYNNNHQIKTDFYIESSFTKDDYFNPKKVEPNQSHLPQLQYQLAPCLSTNKSQCPYLPNVHIHYANIRSIRQDGLLQFANIYHMDALIYLVQNKSFTSLRSFLNYQNQIIQWVDYTLQNSQIIFDGILQPDGYQNMVNHILDFINFSFDEDLKNLILNQLAVQDKLTVIRNGQKMHRIASELQKLFNVNPDMANLINHYSYSRLSGALLKKYDLYDDQIKTVFNEFNEKLKERETPRQVIKKGYMALLTYLKLHRQIYIDMSSNLMDVYTLTRMMYHQNDQVIVYAGYNHVQQYKEFFQFYLNVDLTFEIDMSHVNDLVHRDSVNRCLESQLLQQYIPIDNIVNYNNNLKFFNY
jgi:hypothetical protein